MRFCKDSPIGNGWRGQAAASLCFTLALTGCSDSPAVNAVPEFAAANFQFSVSENDGTPTLAVTASDADQDVLTYSLSGPDSAHFQIDGGGTLSLEAAFDYEAPVDANADGTFELSVSASDSEASASAAVLVALTDVNEAPDLAGEASATYAENQAGVVVTLAANDPERDNVDFALQADGDAVPFAMSAGGQLSLTEPLDFESPSDSNGDGAYELRLLLTDGEHTTEVDFSVRITDVDTTFTAVDVAGSGRPSEVAVTWAMADVPPAVAAWELHAATDGPFSAINRAGAEASELLQEFDLLQDSLEGLRYRVVALDGADNVLAESADLVVVEHLELTDLVGVLRANVSDFADYLGTAMAISGDGKTLAVSSASESSALGAGESDNSAERSGAVYVFSDLPSTGWTQTAFLKAPNAGANDAFGTGLAIDEQGTTLLIGASGDGSDALEVNGDGVNDNLERAGAAHVFELSNGEWTHTGYLKAIGAATERAGMGVSVALDPSGTYAAVGAAYDSNNIGAVHTFRRTSNGWESFERIDNPVSRSGNFGFAVALSNDGRYLAVGAWNDVAEGTNSGRAYVFSRNTSSGTGPRWSTPQILAPDNPESGDYFGSALAISHDGQYLVVGAPAEDSLPGAEDPNPPEDRNANIGVAYFFSRSGQDWTLDARLKPPHAQPGDRWAGAVEISAAGDMVVLGSHAEATSGRGRFDTANDEAGFSGAIAVYRRDSTGWTHDGSFKGPGLRNSSLFGYRMSLSSSTRRLAVSAAGLAHTGPGLSFGERDASYRNAVGLAGGVLLYGGTEPAPLLVGEPSSEQAQ